jgi:hypothetical protein
MAQHADQVGEGRTGVAEIGSETRDGEINADWRMRRHVGAAEF